MSEKLKSTSKTASRRKVKTSSRMQNSNAPKSTYPRYNHMLYLQQTIGNQAVQKLMRSSGRPLPDGIRLDAERRLNQPLDHVRLHDDTDAGLGALQLGAQAVTIGQHIYVTPGQSTHQIMMHELTHVVSQDAAAGFYSGVVPQTHPAEQVARGIEVGSNPKLTRSPVGIYCSPMKRVDFDREMKRRFGVGKVFTGTCAQHKEFINFFGGGTRPGDKLDCSDWEAWSPGADSSVYDWIISAFAAFASKFGGIPSVKEVGFFPISYEPCKTTGELIAKEKVGGAYGGGRMAIYKAAVTKAKEFEVPRGRSISTPAALRDMTEKEGLMHVVMHELGHGLIETALTPRVGWKRPDAEFMTKYRLAAGWTACKSPQLFDAGVKEVEDALKAGNIPPAKYRITTINWNAARWIEQPISAYTTWNPGDDLAEAVSAYVSRPGLLRQRSPRRFNFLENRKAKIAPYLRKDIGPIRLMLTDPQMQKYVIKQPTPLWPGPLIKKEPPKPKEPWIRFKPGPKLEVLF